MDNSAQFIVTGFHRSGTSMAMQTLKKQVYILETTSSAQPLPILMVTSKTSKRLNFTTIG